MEIKVTTHEQRMEQFERRLKLRSFTPGVDWKFSDAEQDKSGIKDTNNCTVIAYANATGARFVDADAAMELCGRKRNKGSTIYFSIDRVSKLLGFGYIKQKHEHKVERPTRWGDEYWTYKKQTLVTFLRENPEGRFVITIRGHASAVVDGKVVDTHRWSKLSRLDGIYRVTEARPEWAA